MHTDFQLLVQEHHRLLLRFRDSSLDLQQLDPDEDHELLGQILAYRDNLLDELESVYPKIMLKKAEMSNDEFKKLTETNALLMQEIGELDIQNEAVLQRFQKSIATNLKQTVINTRAVTSYQQPNFVSGRTISHL